jgi:transcriptional regulator with XRE-family HTH domain
MIMAKPSRMKAREFLKEWRDLRGFSQPRLALAVGVRQATISDIERGKSKTLRLTLLEKLARVLNAEPHELLQPPPEKKG